MRAKIIRKAQSITLRNILLTKMFQIKVKEDVEEESEWKLPLVKAKVETLFGQCRLELGQLDEAYLCFYKAMKYYG